MESSIKARVPGDSFSTEVDPHVDGLAMLVHAGATHPPQSLTSEEFVETTKSPEDSRMTPQILEATPVDEPFLFKENDAKSFGEKQRGRVEANTEGFFKHPSRNTPFKKSSRNVPPGDLDWSASQ